MIGIFEWIALMFKSKAHETLDKYESPRETLDYPYEHQLELFREVRRDVANTATSRKRVEPQVQKTNSEIDRYTVTAQRALESDREDPVREALTRKVGLTTQLQDLQNRRAVLQVEEEKLVRASARLQARMDVFRVRRETIRATYSTVEAQTRISKAFTGISEEMSDVGMAVQYAGGKILQLQVRTSAVDELLVSGALEDPTGSVESDLNRELDTLASGPSIENELAAMKAQPSGGSGTTSPQISSTPTSNFPIIENIRTTSNSGRQARSFVS